jgi:hypothetical protein
MRKPSRLFVVVAAILIAIPVAILQFVRPIRAAGSESVTAAYFHDMVRVTIPYHDLKAGSGRLHIEILDPEDEAIGSSDRMVRANDGDGVWRQEIKLTKATPIEDLAWYRLRYRFTRDGQTEPAAYGMETISQILRSPVIHILGQQSYLSGAQAAVRVIATDSANDPVPGPSTVRIELLPSGQPAQVLFAGALNARGSAEAQFRLPQGLTGSYPLHYVVDTPIGTSEFTQQVRLEDKVQILLTTEKPIYQPAQTIHSRALALDRANHEAASGRKLTFELEDSRGNKVFKKVSQTDRFGIASAEFTLAEEVNLGTYHLRALLGERDNTANRAEIALNVERYVLPKFKVAVDIAGEGNKPKHGYRPGDHVTGTVRANYFFGKSVDEAEVSVKASGMDVAVFDAGSVNGKTDADGDYRFDLQLPPYFAGRPLSQGAAPVLIEATVKDSSGHTETRGEPVTVSQSPLILTAVPEGGTLIPNLENQVYLLASYADGHPAMANLRVHGATDQNVTTDEGGVAIIRLRADPAKETLQIEATDKEGNHATSSVPLNARAGTDQILLRTERAVYRAGDRMLLRVFSTRNKGTAYIDLVKEGQTVLTRDVDIVNGQAELVVTATPALAGTLDCNAYLFGSDARPVGDHRLLFVQPADELKIDASTDAAVYKPGDDAHVRFRVTNAKGEGVQAALGVQVVDEAVFALAEKQPGFAKVFFYLEQEAMKPRYEIHSIGMPEIVEPVAQAQAVRRDRAARALFAATELVNMNRFETEIGRTIPQTKSAAYRQRYQERFLLDIQQLSDALGRVSMQNAGDLTKASGPEFHDAWDTGLRIGRVSWNDKYFSVQSAGPDKKFDDLDDLTVYVEERGGKVGSPPGAGAMNVDVEHERGPINGMAAITGSVVDGAGARISGASITVSPRRDTAEARRLAKANATGEFSLTSLPPGEYRVEVVAPGFIKQARIVALQARDRAVIAATLTVGSATQAVVVDAIAPMNRIRVGGFAGGVVGGVVAGIGGGVGFAQAGALAPPQPEMERFALAAVPAAGLHLNTATGMIVRKAEAREAPRVRSYFPEALYINPEIITDSNGSATISILLADSITTWRMAVTASTQHGALGSGTSSIKVFRDFFVDLDLPVTLTQGDRVSLPVAVYNYSGSRGAVSLKLQAADWFRLVEDVPDKTVAVDSNRVGGSQFTLEARRIGKFKLTLSASMKGRADIVVREIEVVPNGREQNLVFNGRLESVVQHTVNFPPESIPEAQKVLVRLYPGPLSQVIEGMDAILRMPFGCFEQTSSATYPNVLALDYMKRTKKLTAEVHAKAEGFIANGYQRLLTFEVAGGGFSWFGSAPGNKILTAYGLMEFSDMAQIHDVDPKLIARTQQWLASQQQADGSWKPDASFINEGATNRYNSDALRITAYIAWSLENTGYQGPAVEKAHQFVQGHMDAKADAYTLALLANFAADYKKDHDFTRQAMQLLLDARTEKDEQSWWVAQETAMFGGGQSAAVETTGLAAQALLKWGESSSTAAKALHYLAAKKDAAGTWGTTQATIMALRALLLSTEKGAADVRGTVEITLNGKSVQKLELTADNNDLLHQFVFPSTNGTVGLTFAGKGGLAYQMVGRYFVPWSEKPANEPLSIDVAYDRTRLAQDDIATATATVRNHLGKTANMVMVDLGIPPGFDLLSEDLQSYQEKSAARKSGRLEKFNQTATQAILYFDSIAAGDTVSLKFRLRAKYPIRARTFQSRVYEYYDPSVNAVARPIQLEVAKR